MVKAKTYFVINLENFELMKNHPYTLNFEATCPTFCSEIFELVYTGVELSCPAVALPANYLKKICVELQKHFGYGPFDEEKVAQALQEHAQFRVLM